MTTFVEAALTVATARRHLARRFAAAGIDTPELDARVLLAHALGLSSAQLTAAADRALTPREAKLIEEFAARRLAREPVARIVGVKEFWSLPFRLGAATLVPRPETETLVEAALAVLDFEARRAHNLRIADLGTGSGALLLSLLSELPHARGVGTDVSEAALAIARDNAAQLALGGRASFVVSDFGAALAGEFDLIVCNPPYIASDDIPGLAPEVQWDPRLALDGGADGLASYRALAADAARLLAPTGHLIVELGAGAAAAVTDVFASAGFDVAGKPRRDLSGVPRALHVKRAR